ncbi:thiol reductant ABC exporter subunit CydC [Serinibacter arcticus]|uniref:thiol reductant ABC exporter subunit CydC n=1 Tax=Serinibacter arcticus TaxID=1655435 RepID=UPI001304CF05|nr:thiol reductant ABC exporter subunit CydC [Serinibacter arcticus]
MSTPTRPRGPVDVRLLRLARPAGASLVVLVLLSVLQAATALGLALGAGGLVVAVLDDGPWPTWLAVLAASVLVRTVAAGLLPRAAERVSATVIAGARRDGLRALARRGGRPASASPAGGPTPDVAVLLTTGLEPLRPWFASYLPSLVVAAVLPAAAVLLLAVVDWPSATTVLLTLPLVPIFAALIGWATQRRADAQYERGGRLAGHFLDVVRGLVTLRLFDRAERQVVEVRRTSRRYARATTKVLGLAFLSSTALDLVATVSVGLVAVGAGVRLAGGELGLWTALVAILLAPEAYRPLREAGAQFHASAQAGAVMDRLEALLGGDDGATAPPAAAVAGTRAATDAGSGARASDVVVHFRGRRHALRLPDVTVAPGEVVALLGPSGSGKTTLLRVLAGRQAPLTGSADADGALLVPQRPSLPLARTVREALALVGGEAPEAEARAVLDGVGLAAVSLDGLLGDDGTGLSQGQRHRVALAAAALRTRLALAAGESFTLLLDEPTAHLDATSERSVVTLLTDLAHDGAAVLVATHRPAVAGAASRVVYVDTAVEAHEVVPVTPAAPAAPVASSGADPDPDGDDDDDARADGLLSGLRRRWDRLAARPRFALAAAAGAAALLSGVGLTVAASWMIVRADSQPPILTLSLSVVAVRAFAIARPLWRYLERMASHDAGLGLLARWRGDVVAALIPLVPGRLTARRGALLARVVDDVDLRLDGVVRGAVPLASGLAALGVVGLGLLWLLPAALVPYLVAVLLCAVVAPRYLGRAERRDALRRWAAHDDLRDAVVGGAENVDVLDGTLLAEIEARAAASEREEVGAARTEGAGRALAELGATVAAVGIAAVAALTAAGGSGAVSPETVGILVLGALVLGEVLVGLAPASLALQRGRDARARLHALAAESAAVRSATPAEDAIEPEAATTGDATAPLDLRDVSVGWDGHPAVEHVSFQLEAGRTHAIRWASGTGKSTLANVVLGLRPPIAGSVRVAGLRPEVAREQGLVALAGDADHVFATTVRENLRLARPEADDGELVAALLAAHLGPWWAGLEDGLDTWITAEQLSGGERRRLVLARALLRDPEVLVLDEPTAGLDPATAAALLGDLHEDAERRGRALLVMEHRSSGSEAPPSDGDAVLPREAARAHTGEMPLATLHQP